MLFTPSLSSSINPYLLSGGIPAGKDDIQTSSVLDAVDDCGALFIVTFGAIENLGFGLVKLQMSSDQGLTDPFADIEGSAENFETLHAGHGLLLDVCAPHKRFLRVVINRNKPGHITIQSIVALTYSHPAVPGALGSTFNVDGRLSKPGPGAP